MRSTSSLVIGLLLGLSCAAAAGCAARPHAMSRTPAGAPPRHIRAVVDEGQAPPRVATLYDGFDAVGLHEVSAALGWRSAFFDPGATADDVAVWTADGVDSIITTHATRGEVRLAQRRGGEWVRTTVLELEPGPLSIALGDLDGHGSLDLVVSAHGTEPRLLLLPGLPGEGFGEVAVAPLRPRAARPPKVLLHDLDLDGTQDVLATVFTGDRNGPFPDHLRVFRNAEHGRLVDEWTAAAPHRSPRAWATSTKTGFPTRWP